MNDGKQGNLRRGWKTSWIACVLTKTDLCGIWIRCVNIQPVIRRTHFRGRKQRSTVFVRIRKSMPMWCAAILQKKMIMLKSTVMWKNGWISISVRQKRVSGSSTAGMMNCSTLRMERRSKSGIQAAGNRSVSAAILTNIIRKSATTCTTSASLQKSWNGTARNIRQWNRKQCRRRKKSRRRKIKRRGRWNWKPSLGLRKMWRWQSTPTWTTTAFM